MVRWRVGVREGYGQVGAETSAGRRVQRGIQRRQRDYHRMTAGHYLDVSSRRL